MAWRDPPSRSGGSWGRQERYRCERWCLLGQEENVELREQWRCSLLGFDPAEWGRDRMVGPYMGKHAEHRGGRLVEDPLELAEDHDEGCPGGWYRSRWALSVLPYQRPYSQGTFSENIRLSRSHDPLVLEAVEYHEQETLRAQAHYLELITKDV